MALKSYYATGTATVAAGSKAVTGQGTAWSLTLQPGDLFGTHKGLPVRIETVNSDTSLTLAYAWPGAAQTAAPYEVQIVSDAERVTATARDLLVALANGNLASIAGLATAADKLPYFTGAGTAGLATLNASGRALLGLAGANGKMPVWTGSGAASARDIVGAVSQSSGVPTGALFESGSNANGRYARFANGFQLCFGSITSLTSAAATWTYPAIFTGGTPAVTASPAGGAARETSWVNRNNTSVDWNVFDLSGNRQAAVLDLLAVGVWF